MTGINLLPLYCTNQELHLPAHGVSQKNNDVGQAYFFSPPPPLSFFCPHTYPKGYYFYSPQSSTVKKSKMAATTIQTRTKFRPPKICLNCRLIIDVCLGTSFLHCSLYSFTMSFFQDGRFLPVWGLGTSYKGCSLTSFIVIFFKVEGPLKSICKLG